MANNKKLGLPGGPNEYVTHVSDLFSTEGYKRNSPDVNNPFNIISSGNITMEGVDFPVMGTDNLGNSQMMTPGNNYEFPGDQVFEVPMAKTGGGLLDKTMKCNSCGWEWKAADGGADVSTCHKCGSSALPKAQYGIPSAAKLIKSGLQQGVKYSDDIASFLKNVFNGGISEDVVRAGIDKNFLTRPLTPLTKNELTSGKQLYRKIGSTKGLQDLIDKGGAQAPNPFRMKSGVTVDTPFFGIDKKPIESYSGLFAVETPLPSKSKYNWSTQVGGTSNLGVAPFDKATNSPIKNIPLDDLEVFRKKWFSNNYKKLDKQNLQKELKSASLQDLSEKLYKWGIRGYAADQILNDGDLTGGKAVEIIEEYYNNINKKQEGGSLPQAQPGKEIFKQGAKQIAKHSDEIILALKRFLNNADQAINPTLALPPRKGYGNANLDQVINTTANTLRNKGVVTDAYDVAEAIGHYVDNSGIPKNVYRGVKIPIDDAGLSQLSSKRSMVYRDVRPENIMTNNEGMLKMQEYAVGQNLKRLQGIDKNVIGNSDFLHSGAWTSNKQGAMEYGNTGKGIFDDPIFPGELQIRGKISQEAGDYPQGMLQEFLVNKDKPLFGVDRQAMDNIADLISKKLNKPVNEITLKESEEALRSFGIDYFKGSGFRNVPEYHFMPGKMEATNSKFIYKEGGDLPEAQWGTAVKAIGKQAAKYSDEIASLLKNFLNNVDQAKKITSVPNEAINNAIIAGEIGPRIVEKFNDAGKHLGFGRRYLPSKNLIQSVANQTKDLTGLDLNKLYPNSFFHGSPHVIDTPIINNIEELKKMQKESGKSNVPGFYATGDPDYAKVYLGWVNRQTPTGGPRGVYNAMKEAGTNTQLYNFKLKPESKFKPWNRGDNRISSVSIEDRDKLIKEGYDGVFGTNKVSGRPELVILNKDAIVNFNRTTKDIWNPDKAFYGSNRGVNKQTNPPIWYGGGYTGLPEIDNLDLQKLFDAGVKKQKEGGSLPKAQRGIVTIADKISTDKQTPEYQYYNPKVEEDITTGDWKQDFLYNNQWLMDSPILGDYIKNKARKVAELDSNAKRTEYDLEMVDDPDSMYNQRKDKSPSYKGWASIRDHFNNKDQTSLMDQYFSEEPLFPVSEYKPKSDYLEFLPSYSIKGRMDADRGGDQGYKDRLNAGLELTIREAFKKFSGEDGTDAEYTFEDITKSKEFTEFLKNKKTIFINNEESNYLSEALGLDLGGHKTGIAWDKELNLPYISISDAWDFSPDHYSEKWTGNEEERQTAKIQASLMHKAGHPFKIYDRFYFDPESQTKPVGNIYDGDGNLIGGERPLSGIKYYTDKEIEQIKGEKNSKNDSPLPKAQNAGEDVQNAQQDVQNRAVIFAEAPEYTTHQYDINTPIYDSEGNLIANYPSELETLYNNYNQSKTGIEDINNKKIAEKKASSYLQFLIHEKGKMRNQHYAIMDELVAGKYSNLSADSSQVFKLEKKYENLGDQIIQFRKQINKIERDIDKKYNSQLEPLYSNIKRNKEDFYNNERNSQSKNMDSTFYKEAQNLQRVYEKLQPNTNVEIVSIYNNPDAMREKVADLNKNDAMFLFGHSGGTLGGIPNNEIAKIFQESKAENCYLGSCNFETYIEPYTNMVGKNVNYRPSGSWWGVNPNGSTIDEAMWSRVTDQKRSQVTQLGTAKIITPTLGVDYQTKKLKKGGGIEKYTMYKDYVNGIYTGDKKESIAQKNYDRLNRLHYREAKTNQMTPANYILSYLME